MTVYKLMVHSSVNNFTKGNFKQSLKEQLALKPSFVLSDLENNSLISEKQGETRKTQRTYFLYTENTFLIKDKCYTRDKCYTML